MPVTERGGERQNDRMPARTPQSWPGLPSPVVLVVPDSLQAVAAARWAARAARHRATDLALLVPLHCSFGSVPVEVADEARAVAARVLPAVAAHDVVAHAVTTPVARAASERSAAKAHARALADAARTVSAPLVVVCEDTGSTRGRTLLASLPSDILFVPATSTGRPAVVST